MKRLKEFFSTCENKYYPDAADLNFSQITEEVCTRYVENYFKLGGKQFLLNDVLSSKNNGFRATHSTIAYFLSVCIVDKHKKTITKSAPEIGTADLLYILFITYLYHDYYFSIEERKNNCISNDSYQICLNNIKDSKHLEGRYKIENIIQYFEYREKRDHGIIAGSVLFGKLKENLERVLIGGCNSKIVNNLLWSRDHLRLYDLVCSTIIKHNIWLANSDSTDPEQTKRVKTYKENGLTPFIIDDSKRLRFEDDPLLFIFFIIDTIEPVKAYNRLFSTDSSKNYSDLLDDIYLSIGQKSIKIKYTEECKKFFCRTYIAAKSMESWMTLTVNHQCNSKYSVLTINFNQAET